MLRVAILGATGMDGQRFVQMLNGHPWFEIAALTGSDKRVGERYSRTVKWQFEGSIDEKAGSLTVLPTDPKAVDDADVVFSALPSEVALRAEEEFARAGRLVVSNASAHRMDPLVPLIVPEVNIDHVALIDEQRRERRWDGALLTNPNCTATPLVMTLKPILDAYGIKRVIASTMQAASGAGYPGVASLDIIDNVIPYIKGEEEKVEAETLKMLGALNRPADFKISASCHRVPVIDGHTEAVFVETADRAVPNDVIQVMESFSAEPQKLKLPSAPSQPIVVRREEDRPQPRFDRNEGNGMSVVVGRVREDKALGGIKYVLLGHNTIRGAAGCAILTAEFLRMKKLI